MADAGPVPVALYAIFPNAGPAAGGTSVVIFGSGFQAGMSVTVGGASCAPLTVIAPGHLECTTAAHAAGMVDVVATTAVSATLPGAFRYQSNRQYVLYASDFDDSAVYTLSRDANAPFFTLQDSLDTGPSNSSAIVVHPNGQLVYLSNRGTGDLVRLRIDGTDGSVAVEGSPTTGFYGDTLAFDADGAYLYGLTFGGSLAVYAVDPSTGVLTELDDSPYAVAGAQFSGGAMSPDRRFFYGLEYNNGQVRAWALDPDTGVPTEISGSPFDAGTSPTDIVFHPSGLHAYVSDSGLDAVIPYAVDPATGALTPGTPVPIPSPSLNPTAVAMHPLGTKLYVATWTPPRVYVYAIGANGGLTPDGDARFGGTQVSAMTVSPDGAYLAATPQQTEAIPVYALAPSGAILSVEFVVVGNGATPTDAAWAVFDR